MHLDQVICKGHALLHDASYEILMESSSIPKEIVLQLMDDDENENKKYKFCKAHIKKDVALLRTAARRVGKDACRAVGGGASPDVCALQMLHSRRYVLARPSLGDDGGRRRVRSHLSARERLVA